nr:MAG TPA: hypothetical protein [Caudoviricetes sp.]
MQSGRLLVNGNDFYCGNSSGSPCQFALKSQIPSQYVHPSTKQCNYSVDLSGYAKTSELNSLKTSVSEGKSLVAAAVTGKGVSTAADATFHTIADNIESILVGYTKIVNHSTNSRVNYTCGLHNGVISLNCSTLGVYWTIVLG